MGVVTGRDAETSPPGAESVLAGVRRLTVLADGAASSEVVFRELARELLVIPGAEEVHFHHLAEADEADELVVVYMFDANGRLSYLLPAAERPRGVSWVASTSRSLLLGDQEELAANAPRLAQGGAASYALLVPLIERGQVETVVMLVRRSTNPFDERSVELAGTLVDQASAGLALVHARAEAGTDPVAGCLNHRAMRRRLDEEIARAARTGSPLSCLLIDLDDFKLVNDRYGHQAGDAVLREVVQALVGEFRAFDRVARYGGDEFVAILPNADLRSAAAAGARALERLLVLPALDPGTGVSASTAVAEWHAPMGSGAPIHGSDERRLRRKP